MGSASKRGALFYLGLAVFGSSLAWSSGPKLNLKKLRRAVTHFSRACAFENQNKVGDAVNELRKALRDDPDEPYWYQRLGADLEKDGKLQGALDAYSQATQLSPDDSELRSELQDLQKRFTAGGSTTDAAPKSLAGTAQFTPGKNMSPPRAIYQPQPQYSQKARLFKYSTVVVLMIVVDAQGTVVDVRDEHPVGLGLDERAIEAVRTWRFQPATRDGTPVAAKIEVETTFTIR